MTQNHLLKPQAALEKKQFYQVGCGACKKSKLILGVWGCTKNIADYPRRDKHTCKHWSDV